MRWVVLLVLCTGCLLSSKNQEGLQLTINDLKQARTEVEESVKGVAAVVAELNAATVEDRPPVVAPLVTVVTTKLAAAADSIDEAGKTATTLQGGIGVPKSGVNLNFTKAQKEAWRAKYTALAAAWNKAMDWIKNRSPVPIPGGVITAAAPAPWSGTDIATLLTALTGSAAALGLGGRKVNNWRKGSVEARGMATVLKGKCNGDYGTVMGEFPTTVKSYRKDKVNAV